MRVQRYYFLFLFSKIAARNTPILTIFYIISLNGIITKSRLCING